MFVSGPSRVDQLMTVYGTQLPIHDVNVSVSHLGQSGP
jgi:hypothetical protein